MSLTAYETVETYRTADGMLHISAKVAQEHAENVAGDKLQLLMKDVPGMGHQMSYRLTVDMIKNADAYIAALQGLRAFEPPKENGE